MPKINQRIPKKGEWVTKITKENNLKPFSIGNTKLEIITLLEELTNVKIRDIPIDKKVLSLFRDTKALNVSSSEVFHNTGTLCLGIFDTNDFDILLSKLEPQSLEDLKNILKIDFSNSYKYTNAYDFILKEKIKYRNCEEKRLWDSVLYAYYLGYYKLYYPLEFYKVLFDIDLYYLNVEIINKGYEAVKNRILEINDVDISKNIIPKKKSIEIIAEEEGLEIALEILARGIKIRIEKENIREYYQVKINKKNNELIITMNNESENQNGKY